MRRAIALFFVWLAVCTASAPGADLVLAANGASAYQIVLPDKYPSPEIDEGLRQTARLLQAAFQANGVELPVVEESKRDPDKPGIYLGDTEQARRGGIDLKKLKGWSYVHKAVGRDVVIAGRDVPAPTRPEKSAIQAWDRLGTAKAVVDFLATHAGTRFLYPDLPPRAAIRSAGKINFVESPAFEFLKTPSISVPADLNVRKTPTLEFSTGYPPRGSFYDLAMNRFPLVDIVFGGHTYERAVPPETYRETHPEYFALVGGKRLLDGVPQYCISNPEVQELIYQDLIAWIDRGFETVDIGQPDGFRGCQCESCAKLYDIGPDWNEKLWLFHRQLAERVLKARPGNRVFITSYIQTEVPPKTFKAFPANTGILLTGTNEEDIAPWRGAEVPQGFSAYIYNWCPNLVTRYTPMRTPRFVEAQAKRLHKNNILSIYRDGAENLFGLEGPVYYTMGRMFDDPDARQAKVLVHDFCDAAFGKAAPAMVQFYDQLYQGIELYAEFLGTRDPAWHYRNIYGQPRRYVYDPFQMLGFLYTPALLATLDTHLTQAEKTAVTDKAKQRLSLVRREFEYVRSLARVIHLYHAFQIQPDAASRERLLGAIDARNAEIEGLFDARGGPKPIPGWSFMTFPPMGHDAKHLRLAHNGYQEPFANTAVNWDTRAMRQAPLPGAKRLSARTTTDAIKLDSPAWNRAEAHDLAGLPAAPKPALATSFRVLADASNLYVRVESELPAAEMKAASVGRDGDLSKAESVNVFLTPPTSTGVAYQFSVGLDGASKFDAANGMIANPLDPRYGKFDADWNGDWRYETNLDAAKNRWVALLTIPFKTLGTDGPKEGAPWRGNVARIHRGGPDRFESFLWSATPGSKSIDDRNDFGEVIIEGDKKAPAKAPLQEIREKLYKQSFAVPAEWDKLPNPLPTPLGKWLFRRDTLDQGLAAGWFKDPFREAEWEPIVVPSFWAENERIGKYEGVGWHRTTFKVPAEWKGKAVRVSFGAVDEQAWVYVNGRLVREHTEKTEKKKFTDLWDLPFVAEVSPENLVYGGENVLIVRVHNALANGGIWRPVLIHAVEPGKK